MKAILLAAGKGTRISRMIEDIPKSILSIDGIPLLRRTVLMLLERDIKPVVCVGYRDDKIYHALEGLDITYYYNPFYNITNSIASLWFARGELTEDVIIMNGDVYFEEDLLDLTIKTTKDCALLVDTTRTTIGDYFLKLENGFITKFGKDLPLIERSCEYVGVGKISNNFIEEFRNKLEDLIQDQQHQLWWENVLYSLVEEKRIDTLDIEGKFWAEIDYFDDYERILAHVTENKEQITNRG
ncbi:NTP transferase domain-containing protein [Bacillus sinesaloumensis]|uniref:phosphocholine cytidylyltransferase family protein n=1 Tax=Litchfieldia sinesaloumensis TaxID=1926280 RepID=UPI0009887663|nr:phosphocholine cytidylyltransferase family protein [Bacillus sinesaloumensis]